MTDIRWTFEVRKMATVFPEFEPFQRGGNVGFQGALRGKRSKTYGVVVQARASGYPAQAPKIFISPRIGVNWLTDGSLCVHRPWNSHRDTFAQQVSYAASYIAERG